MNIKRKDQAWCVGPFYCKTVCPQYYNTKLVTTLEQIFQYLHKYLYFSLFMLIDCDLDLLKCVFYIQNTDRLGLKDNMNSNA